MGIADSGVGQIHAQRHWHAGWHHDVLTIINTLKIITIIINIPTLHIVIIIIMKVDHFNTHLCVCNGDQLLGSAKTIADTIAANRRSSYS